MAVAKALNAAQGMIDYILGQEGPYGFGSGEDRSQAGLQTAGSASI